jgi:nucleoid-associated protein YgaU
MSAIVAMAPPRGAGGLALTRRGWAAVGLVMLGLVAAGFSAGAATATPAYVPTRTVVVHQGDTLWSIATALDSDGADVAETVDRIRRINGLESSALMPGDLIEVPRE